MSQFHLPYISSSDGDQYYLYHNNTNLPRNAFVAGISPGLLIFKLSTFDARVRQTAQILRTFVKYTFKGLFRHVRVAIDPKIHCPTKMISIVTSLYSLSFIYILNHFRDHQNITLTLAWNVVPNAGNLPRVNAIGSHSFKFPSEYTTARVI